MPSFNLGLLNLEKILFKYKNRLPFLSKALKKIFIKPSLRAGGGTSALL